MKTTGCVLSGDHLIQKQQVTNNDDETKPLDKIIQIGAIQIKKGKIVDESAYNCLINPEIHIPEQASAVHGHL